MPSMLLITQDNVIDVIDVIDKETPRKKMVNKLDIVWTEGGGGSTPVHSF